MTDSMQVAKRRLATIWFTGAGLLFVILFLLTFVPSYANSVTGTWSWYLPTVMPTLSLIVGVLVADASAGTPASRGADPFLFRLALGLSVFYLVVVSMTPLMNVFSARSMTDLLNLSHVWLAPLQGLASAALGAFFVQKKSPEKA